MEADRDSILDALRGVDDPELGLNIVDLGLIYGVEVEGSAIRVRMTLTSPACPLSGQMTREAEEAVRARFPAASSITITVVWDPPWGPDLMPEEVKKRLGWR